MPVSVRPSCVLAMLLALPALAFAQGEQPDPFSTARMRIGPVALTPTIALSNIGVDTNVFNEVEDPKRDFTFTAAPGAEAWLRMGRGRLHSKTSAELVYFNQYAGERSVNLSTEGTFELRLLRVQPFVGGSFLTTRQRPGYEIDARARRREGAGRVGVKLPLTARTSATFEYSRRRIAFDGDAVFLNSYLSEVLNRSVDRVGVTFRHALTPLTTFVLDASTDRERFEASPVRNTNSLRILPGFELDPVALISGTARVGYRKLDMQTPYMPDYQGVVASLDVGYTLLGMTRFAVGVQRDADYSFDPRYPFYVLTGVNLSVTQQVAGPFDARVRGGRQLLDYREVLPTISAIVPLRRDRVLSVGGGIGYRLGRTTRIGFNVDHYRRESAVYERTFNGLRAGMSIEYGVR